MSTFKYKGQTVIFTRTAVELRQRHGVSQGIMQSNALLEQRPGFNVPVDSDATPTLEIVINLPRGYQTPMLSTWMVEVN